MKKLFTIATVLVLALAAASVALAQGGKAEQEIRAINDQLRDAALKGDVATFEKHLADDYVSIGATGAVSTKAQVLDLFRTGKIKYESIDVTDIQVRVYGDTAVVTSTANVKGRLGDQEIAGQFRSVRVFVKRGGTWKAVSFQSTKISP